jgi:Fic family protein
MVPRDDIDQVKEVINYIKALNFGLKELDINPEISIDFIERLHTILIKGTRGSKHLGAFRRNQNWLGPPGSTIFEAIFIPPPPEVVPSAMEKLVSFTNSPVYALSLIKSALVHVQFETIHPFIDGNGRIGRLLITCLLYREKILSRPLLYLSYYLKKNRSQYYELLMKTRHENAWSAWLMFFLNGIIEVADQASTAARDIIALKQKVLQRLYEKKVSSIHAVILVDLLFESPVVDVSSIDDRLHISKDTGTKLVNTFAKAKILKEITGKQRYKKYLFSEYVDIIARGTREGTG